jgi:hypothetical protein
MTASRALRNLCMAFLVAETASPARRVEADARLDAAIGDARALGDYDGLPCSIPVFRAVMHLIAEWRHGSAEMRGGRLGNACSAAVGMALSYLDGTIEAAWPPPSPASLAQRVTQGFGGRED